MRTQRKEEGERSCFESVEIRAYLLGTVFYLNKVCDVPWDCDFVDLDGEGR